MDEFLGRLGIQAVNYAMRCGIAVTSTFALQQCSRLLKTVDDRPQYAELQALQRVLDSKIKIVSPALDLIEFKSGRGNIFLGNAAALAKALHRDIVALGKRLENAAAVEELAQVQSTDRLHTKEQRYAEVVDVIHDVKALLARIDGDIPLLQLAITASGESLSTALPASISPSRLLQASMFLVVGDTQFSGDPCHPVQIGPSFTLSLYMLFIGHSSSNKASDQDAVTSNQIQETKNGNLDIQPYGTGTGERKPIWQEVLHKARVRICRTPPDWEFQHGQGFIPEPGYTRSDSQEGQGEYAYHLEIIEDLDDGRVHEDSTSNTAYDTIPQTGVQEAIPIHQISKLFYTDSGRILNIGMSNDLENTSVLLLKRDMTAAVPTDPVGLVEAEEKDENRESASNGTSYEQDEIDRQLREECCSFEGPNNEKGTEKNSRQGGWRFPGHLDPEWLALEVFVEDSGNPGDGDSDSEELSNSDSDSTVEDEETLTKPAHDQRTSIDSRLAEKMRNMSVLDTAATPNQQQDSNNKNNSPGQDQVQPHVAQSPFGSVISSLSLLEMLVRLTSLQQFQQISHLSIPDHILTFFLEETSATGLRGEDRWNAKRAAEVKMGFDPYTDTPDRAKIGRKAMLQEDRRAGLHESREQDSGLQ